MQNESIKVNEVLENQEVIDKMQGFIKILDEMFQKEEITQDDKDNFTKLWLGENPQSITEERRGIIDNMVIDYVNNIISSGIEKDELITFTKTHIGTLKDELRNGNIKPEELGGSNQINQNEEAEISNIEIEAHEKNEKIRLSLIGLITLLNKNLTKENLDELKEYSLEKLIEMKNNIDTASGVKADDNVLDSSDDINDEEVIAEPESSNENKNEEDELDEALDSIDKESNHKEYIVKKGDSIWNIVIENYGFRKSGDNQKIVDKIKEIIDFQDNGSMKNRLINSNGDTIWIGDKIKLPNN